MAIVGALLFLTLALVGIAVVFNVAGATDLARRANQRSGRSLLAMSSAPTSAVGVRLTGALAAVIGTVGAAFLIAR